MCRRARSATGALRTPAMRRRVTCLNSMRAKRRASGWAKARAWRWARESRRHAEASTCAGPVRLRPRARRRRLPAMSQGIELPDWNSLAGRDDDTLPLLGTALLIARDEYPGLDPGQYDAMAQSHADGLRDEVAAIDSLPLKMQAINQRLFDEIGYTGNHDEYYDPRNSYL